MKKTVVVMLVVVMVLGTMSMAFADASWGPASIFAKLKGDGMTEEQAYALKVETGSTFGELAKTEGFYEEFSEEALAIKKVKLAELVAAEKITQAEADEILLAFENCDGTQLQVLKSSGLFGQRAGNGQGNGLRSMDGEGTQQRLGGNGQGMGQMRRGASN